MTDYENMEAGPEMDALVAHKVMGISPGVVILDEAPEGVVHWEVDKSDEHVVFDRCPQRYSRDIAAAWEVVEKMGRSNSAHPIELQQFDYIWRCNFNSSSGLWMGIAETAPLAICRAALEAVDDDSHG